MLKKLLLPTIIIVRLAANLLFLYLSAPVVIVISFLLDSMDGPLYKHYFHLEPLRAQQIDKTLDYLYYVCLMLAAWRDDVPFLGLLFAMFIYRTIGQLIFMITGKKHIFVFFPNFFEPETFLVYVMVYFNFVLTGQGAPFALILIAVMGEIKVWSELFLHEYNFTFFDNYISPTFKYIWSKLTNTDVKHSLPSAATS